MCRIVGIWSDKPGIAEQCMRMRDCLHRGGPDDAGLFHDVKAGLALGHRRLSIIDLSDTGHQPMSSADGRYTITFNGEIYNYRDLREELVKQGFTFRGTSDTEVLLAGFASRGQAFVERCVGMFAFAVWDSREKILTLFRDRVGVKPLYYYSHSGVFAFASELKGIHALLGDRLEIDKEALGEFLHYGYISAPRSIYRHTFKLEPGHWIRVSQDLAIRKNRYWSVPDYAGQHFVERSEEAYAEELEGIMIDAFTKRLIADVPVGVFLSGGIDSSLVTAILARHSGTHIRTFTIGFREKSYDESSWARAVADHLGTEHIEETVTQDHAREILPLWPEIYDEPFGDISGVPTAIVSRMTREHVKVSLSADGGDELFCGYHRYWVMDRLQRWMAPLPAQVPRTLGRIMGIVGSDTVASLAVSHPKLRLPALRDRMRKFQSVLANWKGDAFRAYPFAVGYWHPTEVAALLGRYDDPRPPLDASSGNILDAMMGWDFSHYLPEDILTKVDRATMYNGLEGRDPMLDHRIVDFSRRLPLSMKYRHGSMKHILKKILGRYLPEGLFTRPKQGFAVPVFSWLHDDLAALVEEHLNPDALRSQGIIDPGTALTAVRAFTDSRTSFLVDRVWLLLVFMMWKKRYNISA
ncbi:asparagine synthase (glutamine-hydrolyzing) [bacterium]|nr:asparagine synthase (glutamine-hydrolyzing) [bacterium]